MSGPLHHLTVRTGAALLGITLGVATPASAADRAARETPQEAALAPDAMDRWTVEARAGDFVRGEVKQIDARVHLTLRDPQGRKVRGYEGLSRGPMQFSFVAATGGRYTLEATNGEDTPGRYSLAAAVVAPEASQSAPKSEPGSARLSQALADLSAGRQTPQAFWAAVSAEGTPWVEPADKREYRVTFLYRSSTAASVRLVSSLQLPDSSLRRHPGSDVWSLSVVLPRGTRFTYKFAPDAPSGPGGTAAVAHADPFNPQRFQEGVDGDLFSVASLTVLPGAAPDVWSHPTGAPAGKVETRRFASRILGNDRDVSIYTPPGLSPSDPAPALLVLFDQEAYNGRIPTPTILDNLIAARRIPPVVAVLIGNQSEQARLRELTANRDVSRMVVEELLPWVRQHHRVTRDPARVVIGGSSLGGFQAAFMAYEHPETFGAVLAQSGSFWYSPTRSPLDPANFDRTTEPGWLVHTLAQAPVRPIRFYLDAGLFEGGEAGGILDTNRYFRDVLRAKGYSVTWAQFAGGHEYVNWRVTLPDGLIALLGDAR